MSDDSPRLVTGAMLGLFLALGADVIVIVAALWYVGEVTSASALRTTAAILAVFALWVVVRWVRLRLDGSDTGDSAADASDDTAETDPVAQLKRRYADGEISDEEFERRIDRLLDADSRAESATRRAPEREGEREFESK
ncbi:SHOCT domain-containing protein [Halobaculum lipolyticum]|uniref:SHOCT domain-containing protein n=1 Tax=Halobaculum lipolyticum TaxID=3032001 RepID=A0ABD5WF52_9EURY|nr:SHOCT domain-containing protein [Halobaculum sp. DT31]